MSTLKILSLRLRGMKGALEELGEETDENVENISKMQGQILNLTKGKVNIFDGAGEFRSTYEIMKDISEVWGDLNSTAQADLLETIAGKHRANSVAALLSNWQNVESAVKSASEAEGSAARENAKYIDSIQGRLDKLTTAWQSFANTFMSSDLLKGAVSVLTSFVEGLEKVIDTIGAFPTLMTTIATAMSSIKGKGFFTVLNKDVASAAKQLAFFGKSFTDIKRDFASGQNIFTSLFRKSITKADVGYITDFINKTKSGVPLTVAWGESMTKASVAGKKMARDIKSGAVSIDVLETAADGGKAGLFGLEVAATAANAALSMGLSIAIQLVVDGVMKLINADKELAESVEEVTSKFKEQHDELTKLKGDYDTSSETSMISKYAKLSKGVDGLGRNVSLTADEYSEYQSIVNSIADQIPSLISGYDEQGNALLSCKGNVEELTTAYEKLIHTQNQEILTNAGNIEENFANTLDKQGGEHWWSDGHGFWAGVANSVGLVGTFSENYDLKNDTAKRIEKLLGATDKAERDKIYKELANDDFAVEEIRTALERANVEIGYFDAPIRVLEETIETDPEKIKGIIDNHYEQFAEIVEQQKTIAQAKLSEAFDISSAISGLNYGNINEELQAVARQTIASLDFDFFENLSEDGKSVEQWTKELLKQLNTVGEAYGDEIENVFELQGKFNNGETTYGEYVKELKEFDTILNKLNLKSEAKEQIRISVGLDEGGVVEQYNTLVKRLTSKNYDFNIDEKEAEAWLSGLSSEDLAIAVEIITETSNNGVNETIAQLQAMLDREKAILGLSLEIDYEVETKKLESLATAISESVSGSGLSTESISAVEGMFSGLSSYDPSKLFERTANGIRLNSEEYRRLNSEYKKINTSNIKKEMDTLGDVYNQTREELYNLTYGTEEYSDKARELDDIESQIKSLEQLAAGYEGLSSAYQEWQMVESAGSQRDMYESVISGFENIDDEISRGWYDDGTIEFLELLTGKDLSTAGIKEVKKAYKGLGKEIENTGYTVRDFFTVDDEGNSTNGGVYNFLDAIGKLEEEAFGGKDVVKRKDGKIVGFDFQIVGGDKVIAEALGISEELVQIMVRAADDAGFVVSMDGTYQQLDVLKEKAQESAESLNRILENSGKKGFDFNFNTSNVDDIKKQLTEAKNILDDFRNTDGTINTELEGADEALTVASTLQSMLDKLTRPTYMDIEVNQVEDELQEPLRNLQELRRLTETEHQLKLSGADTTELQSSINELYTELDGLPDETKIEIGLVDENKQPLTGNALIDKVDDMVSGDAELGIKATVDIQLEMDEKLGILVDKALLDAGIIDNEEFNKRVDIYLNADVDNEDAKNKTEQAVNEVVGGTSERDKYRRGGRELKSKGDGGGKFEKNVDVEVKAGEVNTSDVKDKTEEAVKDESSEKLAVETTVELETTIEEASDLIQKFEDKDITISVTVEGLDDVEELNKNIDLATKIDGSVDNLSEFVKGAKALSELDDNISTFVTADIKGNVTDEFEYKINNLKVFSDSAKDLGKIGFVQSEVSADIKGNVIDKFEYKINNLKVFSDSAKDLSDIGNIESNVKANVEGNVTDEFEYKLNNLKVFSDNAKNIQKIGNVESNVKATVNAGEDGDVIDEFEYKLDNLKKFAEYAKELQGLQDVDVDISATVNTGESGDAADTFEYKLNNLEVFAQGAKALQGIGNVSSEITAKVNTGESGDAVDTFEYKLNNLNTFAEGAKALQGIGNVSSTVTAEINSGNDGDVIEEFEYKLNNLEEFAKYAKDLQGIGEVNVSVTAKVNVGEDGDVADTFEYKLNNLDEFSSYAKDLQGLEDVDISIKANVDTGGDSATDEFEYRLNNLGDFADYAKSLQGLESVDITITANAKGNVVGKKTEGKINNLEVFAKGAKGLSNIESKEVTITANAKGNVVGKKTESKINNLEVFAKGAKKIQGIESKDVTITANTKGNVVGKKTEGKINNLDVFAKGAKSLQGIGSKEINITANADGNVVGKKTEGKINNLKVFGDSAKALNGVSSKEVTITANANGNVISGECASSRLSSLTEFKSLVSGMSNQTVAISVTANVDSANINQAIALLINVANSGVFKDYKATVQVGAKIATIDDTTVKNYKAPQKDGKVKYSVDPTSSVYTWTAPSKDGVVNYSASVDALTDSQKHKTGTITYKAKISGFPVSTGTSNANGSASGRAFARGDWGIKGNGVALGGELGTEIIVRDGKWFTIGDQGAEFFRYKKNDIVFNATQTAALFKYGGIKGANPRGKMFASGTAFAEGLAFTGSSTGNGGGGNAGGNSAGSSTGSDDSSKEFEEVIDWIEVILDRVERSIDKFEQRANNIYKSWSSRNTALNSQISEVGREIELQRAAYNKYVSKANSVGLDASLAAKVRNGEIDIEKIDDEDTADKIKLYKEYIEKALDCKDAIEELSEEESKLYAQRFENIQSQYDSILQGYEHTEAMLNEYINQAEAKGHVVSEKYYKALIANEKQNINTLKQEQAALIAERDKAVAEGKIAKGSEAWHEQCAEIDSVTQAIEEANTSIIEYNNAIREIDWEVFDLIQERISDVIAEADFLVELMSNKKLFEDDGKLTSQGLATMGLHAQNVNTYMYQADDYGAKVSEIDRKIASGELDGYSRDVIDTRREYLEAQREAILNAEQEKEAIKDLVGEGIELELDALQELIDKKNEELESERDLYEYSKKVKEQTEEIASLEKQMAAYSGDDSDEAKQKIQQIKVDLETARQDLQETEYDKFIDDTSALLDTLYNEYELILNTRLDNIDYLLESVIESINLAAGAEGAIATALGSEGALAIAVSNNATSIGTTLTSEASKVGTTLSSAMNNIWNTGEGNAKSVLTMYGENFQKQQTTTNTVLNNIKASIDRMVDDIDKDAQKKVNTPKTQPSSKANPTKGTNNNSNNNKNNNNSSTGDGKPKVGDKVTFVSGQYYYDSQGKKPLGSKYKGKQVYITSVNTESWATHPIHISTGNKLGKGDLGWLKKNQISGYATGKKDFLTDEIAWTQENGREFIVRPSDGAILTPVAKGDSILTSVASNNIWNMANSPAEFIKDNLGIGSANVPNNSNVNNSVVQNFENITFSLPNVHGYNDLLREMQSDPKFEKLILSMTIDQIAGKSKLAKGKSIR